MTTAERHHRLTCTPAAPDTRALATDAFLRLSR